MCWFLLKDINIMNTHRCNIIDLGKQQRLGNKVILNYQSSPKTTSSSSLSLICRNFIIQLCNDFYSLITFISMSTIITYLASFLQWSLIYIIISTRMISNSLLLSFYFIYLVGFIPRGFFNVKMNTLESSSHLSIINNK